MRLQLALNVPDLDAAVAFYEALFAAKVSKRKPGYANFALDEPPLKLVLFEVEDAPERLNHLGVECTDPEAFPAARERLEAAGLVARSEAGSTCCFATQDKVWAHGPDGTRWEWYRVLADSGTFGSPPPEPEGPAPAPPSTGCC